MATLVFIIIVLSFGRYEISSLIPFFAFPMLMIVAARLPAAYLLKKIAVISPLVLFIAAFNPVLDRETALVISGITVSKGWISFFSIILKFLLTAGSALVLIASTGFYEVCVGLERMGVPRVFVMQLLFLYRYIFVLLDEGIRMSRARALRAFGGGRMKIGTAAGLLGNLLLRTVDRSERIHRAMLSRGLDGNIRLLRPLNITPADSAYLLLLSAAFVLLRIYDLPGIVGKLAMEMLR